MDGTSPADDRHICSVAYRRSLSDGDKSAVAVDVIDISLERPERQAFNHNDRVVIANSGLQQASCIRRLRTPDHFESWNMSEPCLEVLAVLRSGTPPCAREGPNHHGRVKASGRHVGRLRRLIDNLIHSHGNEIEEHHLHNRTKSGHGCAECRTYKGRLANRRIPNPTVSESLLKIHRGTEGTACSAHIFAEDDDCRVSFELLSKSEVDRLPVLHHRHVRPPVPTENPAMGFR